MMNPAFKWVIRNGGINTEEGYPYASGTGRTKFCNWNKKMAKLVTIDGYKDVQPNNENALTCAVAQQPVSVAINANSRDFQLYAGGIFNSCSDARSDIDHAVLVVGYGSEGGKDYWIVKNSWTEEWGLDGYVHIERTSGNRRGVCGIHALPSYPVVGTTDDDEEEEDEDNEDHAGTSSHPGPDDDDNDDDQGQPSTGPSTGGTKIEPPPPPTSQTKPPVSKGVYNGAEIKLFYSPPNDIGNDKEESSPQSSTSLFDYTFSIPQHKVATKNPAAIVKKGKATQEGSSTGKYAIINVAIKPLTPRKFFDEEKELLNQWGMSILKEASRQPIDEGIVRQAIVSFNKDTNTVIVNNKKLQLTPTIVEYIFKIPNVPTAKPCTVDVAQQTNKFSHMGLYKEGWVWQFLYYNAASDSQRPQQPLAITTTGELEETPGSSDTGKRLLEGPIGAPSRKKPKLLIKGPVELVQDLVPLVTPPPSIDIQDSHARSPPLDSSAFDHDRTNITQLMIKKDNALAIRIGWNTIVNGIAQIMEAQSRAPEVYKKELEKGKHQFARLMKEGTKKELKLKMKDQQVQT
ncbi:hypothetical protein L7F22_030141 [Adiantum nelumboides]|nr:hypothetical protein [Adiantum nelumboides]